MKINIWPFHQKVSDELAEAALAKERSRQLLIAAKARTETVEQVATKLEAQGKRNHFGEALALSMERRPR